ncbi:MAG: hypothetical protein GF350_11810 [Chitinivibrionales bacterium]|nr:hypothetical protein [Chitinivibrionales bacterium]
MHKSIVHRSMLFPFLAAFTGTGLFAAPVHELGMGIRSKGLSRSMTALASDQSAAYWNPGGLAFMKQRELFAGIGYIGQTNEIDVDGPAGTDDIMRLRFSPAGIVLPVPVARGGLAVSFTFCNPFVFDDILTYSHSYRNGGGLVFTNRDFSTYGSLNYWTAAGALQLAHGLGLGVSFSMITGNEDTRFRFFRSVDGVVSDSIDNNFEDHYKRDYIGFDFRTGLLYRPLENLRIGLRVAAPRVANFDESVKSFIPDKDGRVAFDYDTSGALHSSLEGALGGAYTINPVTVAVDLRGRVPYQVLRPNDEIPDNSSASTVKFGAGGGIELPLVIEPLKIRAGYAFDEYDSHRFAVQYEDDDTPDWRAAPATADPDINSIGVGISFDAAEFGVDAGYNVRFWKLITSGNVEEMHVLHDGAISLQWRF